MLSYDLVYETMLVNEVNYVKTRHDVQLAAAIDAVRGFRQHPFIHVSSTVEGRKEEIE